MKSLILGTAGHIDHGKTALIKALTGIDCDTHPEEKQRGITINLGFSHLDLPDGNSLGIVDVPGHHDFVNTMVAGAHGIDLFMLVIAADSGIMPQTIEHLQIAQTLGIKKGFVALTKIDLVDEESILLLENEIKEFLKEYFLEGCKIIRVSSVDGIGLDAIKNHLVELVSIVEEKPISKIFRMYIDRIFTVSGFGTVVTGSVLGGMVKKSDEIYLLPTNKKLRVRRIERHGKEVMQISAGNRVSLNLMGLNKDEFKKGMLLSDKIIESTTLLDVKIKLFQNVKAVGTWSDAIFLSGTFKNQAKMHLIDKDKIDEGESGIIQLHLSEPCFILKGDKFIIRDTSGLKTLGGGEVIDPYPLHHRRRTSKLINQLKKVADGDYLEYIFAEVRKRRMPVNLKEFAENSERHNAGMNDVSKVSLPEDIVIVKTEEAVFLMFKHMRERIVANILQNIDNHHKQNPLVETGKTLEELIGAVNKVEALSQAPIITSILDELTFEKKLKKVGNTWSLFHHSIQLDQNEQKQINFVEEYIKKSDKHVSLMSDVLIEADKNGINEKKLKQILKLLTLQKKLYRIDESYLHFSIVDDCKNKLLIYLSSHSEGVTVAKFRDLINGNRKICLLMLNLFDDEGITFRDGDLRKITEKGKKLLLENE
jgi:selenocysteine-specific elongation factor